MIVRSRDVVLILLAFPFLALAQVDQLGATVNVGAEYSDNIRRLSDVDDGGELVYSAGATLSYQRQSTRLNAGLQSSIERLIYDTNAFDDETNARVVGSLSADVVENRIFWDAFANHGQQTVNPFQAVTPNNREDITVLTTGPRWSLPVSDRFSVIGEASFSSVEYEIRPLENDRLSGSIGLQRQLTPNRSVSINASGSRLEYDLALVAPPIELQQAFVQMRSRNSRNTLSVELGWNGFEQGGFDGNGLLLNLGWTRDVSSTARLTVNAGTRYSANGDVFQRTQTLGSNAGFGGGVTPQLPQTDDTTDINQAFRDDNLNIALNVRRDRSTFGVSASWRQESVDQDASRDRDVLSLGARAGRTLNDRFSMSASASFSQREFSSNSQSDDDIRLELRGVFVINPKTTATVSLRRSERDSSRTLADFDDNRFLLTLTYIALPR